MAKLGQRGANAYAKDMDIDGDGGWTKGDGSKHHLEPLKAQVILTSSSSAAAGMERLIQEVAVVKSSLTMINSRRASCPLTSQCLASP